MEQLKDNEFECEAADGQGFDNPADLNYKVRQTMNALSVWQQLKAYFLEPTHAVNSVFALLGGYAAGLFVWQLGHQQQLADYVLNNKLPSGDYPSVTLLSAAAILAGLLWISLSIAVARLTHSSVDVVLTRMSGIFFGGMLLIFLPVLALPGIEIDQQPLTFALIALMGVIAAIAAFTVRHSTVGSKVELVLRSLGSEQQETTSSTGWRAWLGGLTVVVLALGYIIYMSVLTVLRHNRFMTHAFDLGIQDQVVYNILHSGQMVTTLLGPTRRVYDHFSPLFYIMAPIYAVFPGASTLLILQSIFLGIGAIPLYLLAKDKTGSTALAVALAGSYLLYPALHGVNVGDFHQIAFVSGLLLFSLYFLERKRDGLLLATLLLALLAKEEVALSVVAIGVYIVLVKRRWILGALVALGGLIYFAVVIQWLMPLIGIMGSAEYRYASFLIPGKGLLQSILLTVITNPLYPINYVLSDPGKLSYLVQLFLPVLFLPFLAPVVTWVVALPALLLSLLTVPGADYGIGFHYSAHITPFIFFLTVLALQRLKLNAYKKSAMAASILVVSLAMSWQYGQIFSKQGISIPRSNEHAAVIRSFISEIPHEASVSTLSDLVPHLSNRESIYLMPIVNDADYLLIDSDPSANFWPFTAQDARGESIRSIVPYLLSGQYGLVRSEDGVLLLKRGHDPSQNQEGLKTLFSAIYEAEDQRSDLPSQDVSDDQASEGEARVGTPAMLAQSDGKEGLIFGPYVRLPQGKYRVVYRLKHGNDGRQGLVATLDVFSNLAGGPLAGMDVLASDFRSSGEYQDFVVDLETQDQYDDVEFRVLYKGLGTLWVDNVAVIPLRVRLAGSETIFDFEN